MKELPGWSKKLLTLALIAAAAAFITRTVLANSRDLADFDWQVRPFVMAASVVAHTGVLVWGVFVWSRLLPFLGVAWSPFGGLLRIWALSSAARYIPGVVWQFLTAARLANAAGLPQVVVATSILLHVILSFIAAAVISVSAVPLIQMGVSPEVATALRIVIPSLALFAVHPRAINLGLQLVTRVFHRHVMAWEGEWIHGLALLGLSLVSWVLYGSAYFLFLTSLAELPPAAIITATGVHSLSTIAGFFVPVPGGLGIRESAMTILLNPILPAGVAAVVAVIARLWSIAAELLLVAVSLLAHRYSPDQEELDLQDGNP